MEDVRNGNIDALKEKAQKQAKPSEFNFVFESGETPISVATMNNDSDMIIWLMDNGAFLDFRSVSLFYKDSTDRISDTYLYIIRGKKINGRPLFTWPRSTTNQMHSR